MSPSTIYRIALPLLIYILSCNSTILTAQMDSSKWKDEVSMVQKKKKEQMAGWMNDAQESLELGDFQNAALSYNKALSIADNINDPIWIAEIRYQLGKIYYEMGKHTSALYEMETILTLEGINHRRIYIQATEYLGDVYLALKEYDQATTQYQQAITQMSNWKPSDRWRILFKLGNCYYAMKSFQRAMIYYQQAMELSEASLSDKDKYMWYIKIGSAHCELKQAKEALEMLNKALTISQKLKPYKAHLVAFAQFNIGKTYLMKGDPVTAGNILEKAKLSNNESPKKNLTLDLSIKLHLGKSFIQRKKWMDAKQVLLQSLLLSRRLNRLEEKKEALGHLSLISEKIGNKDKALLYLKKHLSVRDSLYSRNQEQLQSSERKSRTYEIEARRISQQLKNQIIKEQKRRQNTFRLISVGGLLSLLLVIYLLYSRYQIQLKANLQLEQKNLEIRSQNLLLSNSNTMLEQFAYVASHDMQEPLRMIGSYTTLLKHRYKKSLDKDAMDFLFFIEDAVMRMNHLLKDLLDYSRLSSRNQTFTLISTQKVLQTVLRTMQHRIDEKKATIEIDLPSFPKIFGNEVQVTQLFQNLISNALKFHSDHAPIIEITVHKSTHHYLFQIKDNGIGIHPDFQHKIFNIFQRLHTRDTYDGTGIGLATCKKIVENHGGTIWVESAPGKGSTFCFKIPYQKQDLGKTANKIPTYLNGSSNGLSRDHGKNNGKSSSNGQHLNGHYTDH